MTHEDAQSASAVRVLYGFRELANAVRHVLSASRRCMVISAFVGEGAVGYLPRPKNTTLICWPHPSGTNPAAVSALVKSGVKVFFSDNLHIKLYYGKGLGAVLTSANLSRNGLGGGLKEIGVLLPPDVVDIDRVLSAIPRRKWTQKEHKRLWSQWDDYWRRNGRHTTTTSRANSYTCWFHTLARRTWKLGWWDGYAGFSREDIEYAKSRGLSAPDDYIPAGRANTYKKGDWVLTYRLSGEEQHPRVGTWEWLYIDKVIRGKTGIEPGYPFHAVQLQDWRRQQGIRPPFVVGGAFRRWFAIAAAKVRLTRVKRMIFPTHRFLKLLLPRT